MIYFYYLCCNKSIFFQFSFLNFESACLQLKLTNNPPFVKDSQILIIKYFSFLEQVISFYCAHFAVIVIIVMLAGLAFTQIFTPTFSKHPYKRNEHKRVRIHTSTRLYTGRGRISDMIYDSTVSSI